MVRTVAADAAGIAEGGRLLRSGALVAFPTETVYGLGADATNGEAVASVFEAKGRPHFNPLIVHVADTEQARRLVRFDERADLLAAAFWPGPLSMVLPRRAGCPVTLLAGAGLDTLAVRVPGSPVAIALIRAADRPVAAPSANRSGQVSPTAAAHVTASLGDSVALLVDGGPCSVGVESTVLDLTRTPARVLRPGGITIEALEEVLDRVESGSPHDDMADRPGGVESLRTLRSPGMLLSHYAPALPVRLDVTDLRPGEVLLAFGPGAPEGAISQRNLSPAGDLREAAANLFSMLRELDRPGASGIAVMPVPESGLGRAINDRLRRAAAPRPTVQKRD
ncbi:MAG: L-threonylcarbamoyladenylate synthase [Acetobacterales bacterium]